MEKALAIGGDDFIRKPFEPSELLARMSSCLRRFDGIYQQALSLLEPISLPGGILILPDKNIVASQKKEIHLTPIETGLLRLLVRNPKKTFTYAELYKTVWKTHYLNDKGTVATFISAVKKKLRNSDVSVNIVTIWGEGYCFLPE